MYYVPGEGTDTRVDRWLGIADDTVSVGARELCCAVAVDCSFAKAAAKLKKVGQIVVSGSRMREITEREGVRMLAARKAGLLTPDWDATDCTVKPSKKRW